MKITIDARMYGYENSGIGRYIINLVDQLAQIDDKNKYSILLRSNYFRTLRFPDNWQKVEADFRHYTFSEQLKLNKILKDISPDLVHFPHFNVPIFYKGKFVVTIHDLSMHKRTGMAATTLPFWLYAIKRSGYRRVFNKAIKDSQKIIVPSEFVLGELVKKYPLAAGKTTCVYEGVDQKFYSAEPIKGLLKSLGIEKPFFLYVGNAYPHKNIARAIEAIVGLNAESKEAQFIVVTPRNVFMKRLGEEVVALNATKFVKVLGFLSDDKLKHLYRHAAAFVYPSKEEGFGLPGLEAMATKTLVLASDISVFREVYKDHVIYFNPHDFSSIQKTMSAALSFSRLKKNQITDRALEFSKSYSWTKTAEETLKIYNSVSADMSGAS